MRTVPTIKIYAMHSGTETKMSNSTTQVVPDVHAAFGYIGENGFMISGNDMISNNYYCFHYTADAEL